MGSAESRARLRRVLVVRGTKKLRDRVKGPFADARDTSTTALGDWFATALFWRPNAALFVNRRTLLPVFTELVPAVTLLTRAPEAIEAVLRLHGADDAFVSAEHAAMSDVRLAPTNDRSVVGVMNEFALHAKFHRDDGLHDLCELSLRMAHLPLGPLRDRTRFPDRELAAVLGNDAPLARVIPFQTRSTHANDADVPGAPRGRIYQLKITLLGTKPPVWRRVLVDGTATLGQLHATIQAAFGWWNCHLHEFEVGRARYGVPDPDDDWGDPPIDELRTRLDSIVGEGSSFRYTYDFGDGWIHRVVVERVVPASTATTVPACIDGRRACPPEDCGGPGGYAELLEILADPGHPEHEERREWLGRPFDPVVFDPGEFSDNLGSVRLGTFEDLV